MQQPSNQERRTALRVAVDLLLNKYINGRPHTVRATNISRGGFRLQRLFEPHNNNKTIGLQFQLPDSERVITCAARVVESDQRADSQGIAITHIDPEHQRLLDDFILSQTSSF